MPDLSLFLLRFRYIGPARATNQSPKEVSLVPSNSPKQEYDHCVDSDTNHHARHKTPVLLSLCRTQTTAAMVHVGYVTRTLKVRIKHQPLLGYHSILSTIVR